MNLIVKAYQLKFTNIILILQIIAYHAFMLHCEVGRAMVALHESPSWTKFSSISGVLISPLYTYHSWCCICLIFVYRLLNTCRLLCKRLLHLNLVFSTTAASFQSEISICSKEKIYRKNRKYPTINKQTKLKYLQW